MMYIANLFEAHITGSLSLISAFVLDIDLDANATSLQSSSYAVQQLQGCKMKYLQGSLS
jgi:hypothetical protein